MPLSYDYLYYEEGPLELVISPGEVKELKYNVQYGGNVVVKISATKNPVIVCLSCSSVKVDGRELRENSEEFSFTANPDAELLIRLEGKRGFLANRARVTLEVRMYTIEKAVELSQEIAEMHDMAKYMGFIFYEVKKDRIMELMNEIVKFWSLISYETKNKVKEITSLIEQARNRIFISEELTKLKRMLDEKVITMEEFEKAKKRILES